MWRREEGWGCRGQRCVWCMGTVSPSQSQQRGRHHGTRLAGGPGGLGPAHSPHLVPPGPLTPALLQIGPGLGDGWESRDRANSRVKSWLWSDPLARWWRHFPGSGLRPGCQVQGASRGVWGSSWQWNSLAWDVGARARGVSARRFLKPWGDRITREWMSWGEGTRTKDSAHSSPSRGPREEAGGKPGDWREGRSGSLAWFCW